MKNKALGKDEFLKAQSQRFDDSVAHPHLGLSILGSVFIGIIFFGLYELICWTIFKLMDLAKTKNASLSFEDQSVNT